MGSALQKILQGRGGKEGKGLWLKRGIPFLLLCSAVVAFFFEFPFQKPWIWVPLSVVTLCTCAALHFFYRRKSYHIEFLTAVGIFLAGIIKSVSLPWLEAIFFPASLLIGAFYPVRYLLFFLSIIPLFYAKEIVRGDDITAVAVFFILLSTTAGIFLFLNARRGNERRDDPIQEPVEADFPKSADPRISSFSDEQVFSHYLDTMFRPVDECEELLKVVKKTILADSVSLFTGSDGSLRLKCSTEETGRIIPSEGGVITLCFREKKPFLSSDVGEKKLDIGYLKKEKISSLAVVPVIDQEFSLGVLSADSARFHAFSSADQGTMEIFARQIARILQRERMFPQIRRSYDYLKILHEESAKLLSSLNMDIIVQTLMEGARKIAPSETVFLIAEGMEFRIFPAPDPDASGKNLVNVKGTLVDVVIKNRQRVYISDMRNYRSPILPFRTGTVASAFILPLLYEKEILGVLLLLMDKVHSLHSRQAELLEVLGNQAATSMINARFHAEIEKIAVTDGLTGLFNHRHFQERIAEELSRLQRFRNPLSLLILDIDYFKKINDTYGHPVGDSVLKEVAHIIKRTIRNIDVAARYGGEEFAVILIETSAKGAMKMAERLRKTVMKARFSSEKMVFSVTVSIRIATFPEGGNLKEELIENADKALYHAKEAGRNQSVHWQDISAMRQT